MPSGRGHKTAEIEAILSGILDPQELEVVVVRPKGCEVVFSNAKAKMRLYSVSDYAQSCKKSFAKSFPDICEYCPYGGKTAEVSQKPFEIKDYDGRTCVVRCNTVNWVDGKPAVVFTLHDVTDERELKERLHDLAYNDQLTGVPNRQRLKDVFEELEVDIGSNKLSGIIALFDIDNFKTVNDTYGHNTGDMVLRGLTEYFEDDKAFSGRLYRLGGDEFVLLFADPVGKYGTDEEMKEHYLNLLSTALRTYTLPNIEAKCTLSIGISFFPMHGDTLSEVLRKADIALYKAKAEGRNRIVFFESQYDTAQKFKDLYINVQPVLFSAGKTFGYELVDRGFNDEDDDGSVSLNEFNRTVDALGLYNIANKEQYFITYSKQFLNHAVLKNLPREKFIVQVQLSNQFSEYEMQKVLQICIELRKNGYQLALAGLQSSANSQALLDITDYCKFSPADVNKMKQKRIISANAKVKFIATNVDTQEAFRSAKDMGFHLFQGYYFNQPAVGNKIKAISPLKANYFRLLKLTSNTDDYMNFREISTIISYDVALTYKLLRILNSAAVGLRNVASIPMAVAYLGEENLKKWIAVLALSGIAEDKPLELVRMSLIRARFGELLATHYKAKRDAKEAYMVGMLSLLHVALDITKEELFEEINVSDSIKSSLMTNMGPFSDMLRFFEYYEYANWEAVSKYVVENQLDSQYVNEAYFDAVKWYKILNG